MAPPRAPSSPAHGVRHSPFPLLATFVALAAILLTLLGTAHPASAAGTIPDRPDNLVYAAEGSEVSAPDLEAITSLMNGLNSVHKEKVGILITDADEDAQALSDKALKSWGLDKSGAIIVITTAKQGIGLAVSSDLTKRVPLTDQDDVVNKVGEGIGQYNDWATGIQSGATRLFLYIEGEGLGGGTDDHSSDDGHAHEGVNPAPPENTNAGDSKGAGLSDPLKITLGSVLFAGAGVALFFLLRKSRRKAQSSAPSGTDAPGGSE